MLLPSISWRDDKTKLLQVVQHAVAKLLARLTFYLTLSPIFWKVKVQYISIPIENIYKMFLI